MKMIFEKEKKKSTIISISPFPLYKIKMPHPAKNMMLAAIAVTQSQSQEDAGKPACRKPVRACIKLPQANQQELFVTPAQPRRSLPAAQDFSAKRRRVEFEKSLAVRSKPDDEDSSNIMVRFELPDALGSGNLCRNLMEEFDEEEFDDKLDC